VSSSPLSIDFTAMKEFKNSGKLKQACMTYIASQLSGDDIGKLSQVFEKLDTNSNGSLTYQEIKEGLKSLDEKLAKEV